MDHTSIYNMPVYLRNFYHKTMIEEMKASTPAPPTPGQSKAKANKRR